MEQITAQTLPYFPKKLKNIALQEIPGAAEEHIRLFKQSNDDGIRTYEGTIIYEDNKYDFEIDANDGTILEWDMEPIYD